MADQALTEQLNGLIGLLQAVGIDSVDNREMKKACIALKNNGSGAPIVFPSDIPEAKQLNDDQIQAMILKLQQAKAQAPNLMEAMESYLGINNGSKAAAKKKKKKKATGKAAKPKKLAPPPRDGPATKQLHQPEPEYEEEEEEEEEYYYETEVVEEEPQRNDHDDYDEDEDDDDFDEDADYPMVGPGISDDVSVVSDMTTPTVVSSLHIHDEEQYSDMLPSMYGVNRNGVVVQAPKRKNLVSKVGGRATAGGVPMRVGSQGGAAAQRQTQAGGAAAKRRQTYQETMSRLDQNPYGTTMAGPAVNHNVPVISEEDEDLGSQSYHSKPEGWQPFSEDSSQNMDESGHSGTRRKKKGTKVVKKKDGAASPKPKKKKPPAGTTVDRSGFPADGKGPAANKPKKPKDQLAKSTHSSASASATGVKKKKKIVKKVSGEGAQVAAPKPRKKAAPKT